MELATQEQHLTSFLDFFFSIKRHLWPNCAFDTLVLWGAVSGSRVYSLVFPVCCPVERRVPVPAGLAHAWSRQS